MLNKRSVSNYVNGMAHALSSFFCFSLTKNNGLNRGELVCHHNSYKIILLCSGEYLFSHCSVQTSRKMMGSVSCTQLYNENIGKVTNV